MADKNTRVTVSINNQEYTVITEESPDYIRFLAHAVDDKYQEIHRSSTGLDTNRKTMLTALNIMDDYEKLNQRYKMLYEKYRQSLSQRESQG